MGGRPLYATNKLIQTLNIFRSSGNVTVVRSKIHKMKGNMFHFRELKLKTNDFCKTCLEKYEERPQNEYFKRIWPDFWPVVPPPGEKIQRFMDRTCVTLCVTAHFYTQFIRIGKTKIKDMMITSRQNHLFRNSYEMLTCFHGESLELFGMKMWNCSGCIS